MSGQHTPGPWVVAVTADDLIVVGRQKIASTYDVPGDIWGAANARLIAAAPELLEALETVMQWVKAWDVGFLFDDEWPADEAKINAAIAKARGEA